MPQTNYRINTAARLFVMAGITVMLSAFGITGAIASEITGTLSAGISSVRVLVTNVSTGGGRVSGTVIGSPNTSQHSTSSIAGSDTGSMAIYSPSPSSDADLTGTGGGYDPNLDSYLAAQRGNQAIAGDTSTGKVMTIVLVGLAVVGLVGYAFNSYLVYQRERGL